MWLVNGTVFFYGICTSFSSPGCNPSRAMRTTSVFLAMRGQEVFIRTTTAIWRFKVDPMIKTA
jgi:hypothetical protein